MLDHLTELFESSRDPERAAAMRAYMRDQFPFVGIPAPGQQRLARQATAGVPVPDEAGLLAVADACWARDEREYQYFGCGYLRRHVGVLSADALPALRRLITTKPWWDTIDALAVRVVGPLVARHGLATAMDAWVVDDDKWVVRTALLHQLMYKRDTDTERLFGSCTRQAGHTDFFVRKAIGWALREYAKTDPDAVRSYVAATPALSGLSRREALKNL